MDSALQISQELNDSACFGQGTMEWFAARLGYITSSNVHFVMKVPKVTKTNPNPETFSDTTKGYLYKVAAERNLRDSIVQGSKIMDPEMFEEYLYRVEVSNKAIRYGQENEEIARVAYQRLTKYEVVTMGFQKHPTIERYGDSPDGVVLDENQKPIGALEIKCPKPDTFMRYKATIHNAEELKEEKPEYYWQCQSHCECLGVQWCDFVFFDKMQKKGFVCIRIERNEEDIARMKERIVLANQFVDELLN